MGFYFSEHFQIDESLLEQHGALNICLMFDLPLFIDPFLLYASEKPELRALHEQIIEYLWFLRRIAPRVHNGWDLKEYFCFSEVRQTWLGFTGRGNQGSGLGMTFAKSLRGSLDSILADLSGERITKSSHFEKVALFSKGIGKDRISDFTTNLIKNHLLEYSQEFALKHLYRGERATFEVPRAEFDFSRKRWVSKKYELPKYRGQYLLLTPMEILTGGDTWINRSDMVRKLWDLVPSVGNEELRARINKYMERELQGRLTQRQEQAVKLNAMAEFTEMYDYYIKAKEDNASEAFDESRRYVRQVQQIHIHQIRSIIVDLESTTRFYTSNPASFETSRSRVLALKAYIERGGGHHNFTNDGKPLNEPELGLITSILWSTINGPEKPYQLHWHEPDLVFKRGNNSRLSNVLDKHLASLRDAPGPPKSLIVIVNYTQAEDAKTAKLIRDFEILGDPTVVTIDARGRLSNRPKPNSHG